MFPEVEGSARQLVTAGAGPGLPVTETTAQALAAALAAEAGRGFDLTAELPVRCRLFAVGPAEHVLLIVIHHIVMDGWSFGPLGRDLSLAYAARCQGSVPGFAPLPVQYADYALWQRWVIGVEDEPGSLAAAQLAHWRGVLAGLPDELELPADRSRPARASQRGATVPVELDAGLHGQLLELARATGTSLFMVLHAGLAVLLHRLGGGTDIPVGTPVSGRGDPAAEDVIGCFLNILVLRTDISGDPSFTELLARVREADLAAFDHAELPFDRVVEAVNPVRSLARHPLFQVMLILQNTPAWEFEFPGLTVAQEYVHTGTARFDLVVELTELAGGGIRGEVEYSTDLYDRATVEGLAARLARLLTAVAGQPGQPVSRPALLGPAEYDQIVTGWNDTAVQAAFVPVPRQVEERAGAAPATWRSPAGAAG